MGKGPLNLAAAASARPLTPGCPTDSTHPKQSPSGLAQAVGAALSIPSGEPESLGTGSPWDNY